jgi:hypothetical protein
MEAWGAFLKAFASVPEGDGTLLDNTIILAHSETKFAKYHTIDSVPMMIAGKGGGKIKPGIHIAGKGLPASCVGLTLMQLMGVPMDSWGTGRMKTSKSVGELLA